MKTIEITTLNDNKATIYVDKIVMLVEAPEDDYRVANHTIIHTISNKIESKEEYHDVLNLINS